MSENETLADIRKESEALFREFCTNWIGTKKLTYGCEQAQAMLRFNGIFDRIEAARKREIDKLNSVIQAQRSAFDAEQDRQRRAVLKNTAPGDAAAMREVVMALAAVILPPRDNAGEDGWLAWVRAMQCKARAALAAPPRNCDVGTAEEQDARYNKLCEPLRSCGQCPVYVKAQGVDHCEFVWAQMPYNEKGGGK